MNMKTSRNSIFTRQAVCLVLLTALATASLMTTRSQAQAPASAVNTFQAPADKVSPDLRELTAAGTASASVILQLNDKPSGQLNALLNRNGVHVRNDFNLLKAKAIDVPASLIDELAAFGEVDSVSLDRVVKPSGHVSVTTGAEAANTLYNLDASGIVVAVLDSGVDITHKAFLNKKLWRDFTTGQVQQGLHRRKSHGRSLRARHARGCAGNGQSVH